MLSGIPYWVSIEAALGEWAVPSVRDYMPIACKQVPSGIKVRYWVGRFSNVVRDISATHYLKWHPRPTFHWDPHIREEYAQIG